MNNRAQIRMLPDGRRLHMHDGPIDVIVEAFGAFSEIEVAYRAAAARFVGILDELCGELEFLRRAACEDGDLPSGAIARRMMAAVRPYASQTFITPMAAVAGAVAEEILEVMTSAIESGDPIRGIATSGWRGRSFSLGIADAVTVLADTAAMADAAATVIANAVDLPRHPRVERVRACDLAPDSDLGERLVTQSVGELTPGEIRDALEAGIRLAESLRGSGLIRAAALNLQGETRVIGAQGRAQLVDIPVPDGSPVHA